jgi:hypothetical protein
VQSEKTIGKGVTEGGAEAREGERLAVAEAELEEEAEMTAFDFEGTAGEGV